MKMIKVKLMMRWARE